MVYRTCFVSFDETTHEINFNGRHPKHWAIRRHAHLSLTQQYMCVKIPAQWLTPFPEHFPQSGNFTDDMLTHFWFSHICENARTNPNNCGWQSRTRKVDGSRRGSKAYWELIKFHNWGVIRQQGCVRVRNVQDQGRGHDFLSSSCPRGRGQASRRGDWKCGSVKCSRSKSEDGKCGVENAGVD